MSPIREAGLTFLRETRRNTRSAKGIVMGVLFLLIGAGASLIYSALSHLATTQANGAQVPEEMLRQAREQAWTKVWTEQIGHYVSDSPFVLVALFKVTLWFIPFLALMIGFDQVCGDVQHRTIRYHAIRARRGSVIAGKAAAIWGIVSGLLLVLHLFVWIVTLVRGDAHLGVVLSWGGRLWLFTSVYAFAYAGLTVLISSLQRRPILALFIGLAVMASIWMTDVAVDLALAIDDKKYGWARYIGHLIPDFYEKWLVSPAPAHLSAALAFLLAFGAGATALAGWLVTRRDI